MVKAPPAPAFIVTQSQFLLEFLVVPLDDPAVFGEFHQRLQRRPGRLSSTASILWVPMLPSAIRSKAILPGVARCASHRDGRDAHGRRQNGSAEFPCCPGASRCPSRLKRADSSANCFDRNRLMIVSRRRRLGGAPRPGFRGGAGKGCCPGFQTVVDDSMPTVYCSPSSVTAGAELRAVSIACIRQYHAQRNLLFIACRICSSAISGLV